jgi:ADP-ribosylglycohydrolase
MYFALDRGLSVQELSKTIGSGGYLLETVPNVLFLFVRYLNDPQRGITEAVNFTKDNDTIASIVASVFGALYGRQAFREE